MVKEFLSQRGVSFQERDVSLNASYAAELVRNTGQRGVPVTVIDGKMVIGYDPAQLEPLLKQTRQRPPFGASIADAGKITAKLGTGITLGAYIGSVKPGSIAARIGLAAGDIIIGINLENVATARDFEMAVTGLHGGSRFSIYFLRGNQSKTAEGTF
jgi:S1-C subfamily serine protease